ncbi:la-related protein 1C-like [Hibiscus syriacus]|uniref:la-related protein 1C-like n=1 Tax=Hibiscus syriacus TaxID=106335 RepID=UPI0019215013|nr:la-related protein 1C-like [Hibiscus syriacus]
MAANINTANFNTSAAVTAVNHSSSPNQTYPATRPGSSSITAVPSLSWSYSLSSPSTENENVGYNSNAGKKPAWNKPNNNHAESGSDMEACNWPPLSGSARSLCKSSSGSASLDGSSSTSFVPVSQGSRTVSSSSPPQKQVMNNGNLNSNSTPNHTMPVRHRSMKQNSSFSATNGGLSRPLPQGPMVDTPLNGPSSRDHVQRTVFVPSSGGNDQCNLQNSFRPRNSVAHPRAYGSHHLNYGGRPNQDHGNQDWNGRSFINRDGHMLPRGVPRFIRHPPPPPPPPNTGAFFAPPHVRFGTPMGFHDYSSQFYLVPAPHPESYRGVPFFQPVSPMFLPPNLQDQQLHARIMNQINYYFSNENLIKDIFLRKNMDDQGWVRIKLIAD